MAATSSRAEWYEASGSLAGISREQFDSAGLARLTKEEYQRLLAVVYSSRESAANNAVAAQYKYYCGPIPTNYDRVKVYVETTGKTPTEMSSGLRQRLSSLRDVQIVYTEIEADVGIELIGSENLVGNRSVGYLASVISFDPCKGSIFDKTWSFRYVTDHFMQGGPEAPEVINRIVSDIDTNTLERVRKFHANIQR